MIPIFILLEVAILIFVISLPLKAAKKSKLNYKRPGQHELGEVAVNERGYLEPYKPSGDIHTVR